MSDIVTSVGADALDLKRGTLTVALQSGEAVQKIEISLGAAVSLVNVLMVMTASAEQQRVSAKTIPAGAMEYGVPLRVNQLSAAPDAMGEEVGVWFEKDTSFRLL